MKSLSMHTLRCVYRLSGPWAILAALSLGSLPAHAAQPQSVEGTGVYLSTDPGPSQPNPGGRIRTQIKATAMMVFNTPLLTGELQWEGDFNMDLDSNGTCTVRGTIELGSWETGFFVAFEGEEAGEWVTKAEGHGNLQTGYVGICVAHGISGRVKGMIAVLRFTGGPQTVNLGTGEFTTLVDVYEDGQIIIPRAAK
jgi:hypothetical protein